jgi:hypothetical protein
MSKKVMKCRGSFTKKDECEREFFFALREDKNPCGKVTILYVVDKNGCPIERGNLIVLPHEDESENGILLCNNINEHLGFTLNENGALESDESCDDNSYIG